MKCSICDEQIESKEDLAEVVDGEPICAECFDDDDDDEDGGILIDDEDDDGDEEDDDGDEED